MNNLLDVFPTLVGVFPAAVVRRTRPYRLPHARGGVSERVTTTDGPI